MTIDIDYDGQTYLAKLVYKMLVNDDCEYYYLYVDEVQHMLLVQNNTSKVVYAAHLESWQQDALIKKDKTIKDMAKARKVIDTFKKKWGI